MGSLRSYGALCLLVFAVVACDPGTRSSATREPTSTPTPLVTPGAAAPAGPTPPASGTLRYAISEPVAIVPGDAIGPEERLIVDTLFDSLTALTASLAVAPGAAVAWTSDEAGTTWTFRLREGATFHDGSPVTSEDFAFAWNLAAATGRAGFLLEDVAGYEAVVAGRAGTLAGVHAVDALTLEVELSRPDGAFPTVAAHPALGPVPAERWLSDEAGFRAQPVGNGPFVAAEALAPGQFLRLEAFDEWRNGREPSQLDEVLFQFLDPATAYLAFQQDRLQIGPLPREAVPQAIQIYGISVDGYQGPGVIQGETPVLYFLGFNTQEPPFDDPQVRRAVSLAVDRFALAEAVVGANAVPAASVTSPLIRVHDEDTCTACTRDVDEAREIFAERDVSELEFWFNADGGHQAVAAQLVADLREAGIRRVGFVSPPFDDYLAALDAGAADFFRFGWTPEHPTPGDVLWPLFHSSQIGDRNYSRYSNPEVDLLLEGARSSTSLLGRSVRYLLAERQIVGVDQAVVPLLFYRHQQVVSARVHGYVLDPMGLANLEEVRLRSD